MVREIHTIHNDRAEIDAAEERLLYAMTSAGYAEASKFAVRLSLEEAVSNAFRHGHKNLTDREPVTIEFDVSPQRVELVVEDSGPGFDPESVPDPRLDENLELPAGRGILLIRSYMSEVHFEGRGNRLRMVYAKPTRDES